MKKSLQELKTRLYLHSQLCNGLVVQLVGIPACHAGGREFESRPDRKKTHRKMCFLFLGNSVAVLCQITRYKELKLNNPQKLIISLKNFLNLIVE